MRLKHILFSTLLVFAVTINVFAKDLTVAVAANMQYPFEEIQSSFTAETGIVIKPVIGSSGKFTAQIESGAPFDIFISADMDYPQALEKEGMTIGETKTYAFGKLVIWSLKDIDISKGIEALTGKEIVKVAIASPKVAPYGRQAVNAMKYYKLYVAVQQKLVYGENISQTNQFIISKASDAGITAKSVVMAPNMKDKGKWVEVDSKSYEPIAQGAVILKHAGENNDDAQKFYKFLFSPAARAILAKYGYDLPKEKK